MYLENKLVKTQNKKQDNQNAVLNFYTSISTSKNFISIALIKKELTFAALNKFVIKYICTQNGLQNIKQKKNQRQALHRCF